MGGAALNKSPLAETKSSRVVMVSHWMSGGNFSLAGAVAGQ